MYHTNRLDGSKADLTGWREDKLGLKNLALTSVGENEWDIIFTDRNGKKDKASELNYITVLHKSGHALMLSVANALRDSQSIYHFSRNDKGEYALMYLNTWAGMQSTMFPTEPSSSLFVARCE